MSTTKTSAQVPKLRFPGFAGEWKETTLSDAITSLDAGVSVNSEDTPVSGDELGILKTSCVTKGYFDPSENKRVVDAVEVHRLREPASKDSIIISRMNTPALVGLSGLVTQDEKRLFLPDRLWAAKISPNHAPRWIAQLLASEKVRGQLSERASGTSGSMKNITKGDVFSLPVVTPKLPEQQKIAAFLTAVDGRIEQLSRKKALLEATKKGVMQQLFTQTLRFQDDHGHDFPGWEEKTLGELTTWTSGGTPSKDEPSYWDGDIPWLSAASMHERYYDDSPLKISEEGLRNGSRIAKKGSLLLLVRGSMLWNRIPVGIAKRDLAFNQDVKALVPTKAVQAEFLLQWFIASENLLLHAVVGTGIGAGKLDTEEMKRLQVQLPSLPEQTKIAGFLSALDGKIGAVGEQMRQTQAWKKGLLQQMFV